MKKLVLIVVMSGLNAVAFAQYDVITKFFGKYADDESFTQVTISSKMFSLFTNMEASTAEDKEILDAISKLKGLRILAKEDARDARALYKEAFSLIPVKEYEELMTVRDKDNDMKFLIKENGGKISELLMVMGGTDDFMILSLIGDIDLKQVSRIGKKMNVSGLDQLRHMHDGDDDEKKEQPQKTQPRSGDKTN